MKRKRFSRAVFSCIIVVVTFLGTGCNAGSFWHEAEQALRISEDIDQSTAVSSIFSPPDSTELVSQYMEITAEQMEVQQEKAAEPEPPQNRGSRLKGNERVIYEQVVPEIRKIAAGKRTDTMIEISGDLLLRGKTEFTAEDLGQKTLIRNGRITEEAVDAFYSLFNCDYEQVLDSLETDLPFDFYWFDSVTEGVSGHSEYDGFGESNAMTVTFVDGNRVASQRALFPMIYLGFHVAPNYSRSGKAGTFEVDPEKMSAARAASEHARSIVESARDLTDLEKLETYRDAVCVLTDYDHEVLENFSGSMQCRNTDPWQLIYVFDNDPETKAICAGYTRALQFLCDMTQFKDPGIRCYTVTGRKDGMWHMWNVIRMDDGENYLADITCCDTGPAATDEAFLKGSGEGNAYQYDSKTRFLFEDSELELSKFDYGEKQFEGEVRLTRAEPEVTLAKKRFNWTGKQIHPQLTVKVGDAGYLTPAEYIVSFAGDAASAGLHRLTVTLKGRFRGSREEEYIIRPAGTAVSGIDPDGDGFIVRWEKQRLETTGYQLQYGTDQSFHKNTETIDVDHNWISSKKIKVSEPNQTYYVRIRTVLKNDDGVFCSKWSKKKKIHQE